MLYATLHKCEQEHNGLTGLGNGQQGVEAILPCHQNLSRFAIVICSILPVIVSHVPTHPGCAVYFTLLAVEAFCVIVFTLEYGVRLATTPNYRKFFFSFFDTIDLLSILPFYLEVRERFAPHALSQQHASTSLHRQCFRISSWTCPVSVMASVCRIVLDSYVACM